MGQGVSTRSEIPPSSSVNPTEQGNLANKTRKNNGRVVVGNTLGNHVGASTDATKKRELANALTTAGQVGSGAGILPTQLLAALNAGKFVTLAGTTAVAATFPPLLAALFATYMITLFVLRQRGLNQELISNLYIIKTEIERMQRVYQVMAVIAKEREIDLNISSLTAVVVNLGKKIMLFAGPDTRREINQIEAFLSASTIDMKSINAYIQKLDDDAKKDVISYLEDNGIIIPANKEQAG